MRSRLPHPCLFRNTALGIWYTIGDTSKAPQTVYRDEVFSYKRRRHMARQDKDDEREESIRLVVIDDADGTGEQAIGRYNYLTDTLHFPFTDLCVERRDISPLATDASIPYVGSH